MAADELIVHGACEHNLKDKAVCALGLLCLAVICLASGAAAFPTQPSGTLVVASQGALFLVDANGKKLRPFTRGGEWDAEPTWSPDGRSVAFLRSDYVAGRLRSGRIAVKTVGGSTRIVAPTGRDAQGLSWSPDGEWFAYAKAGGVQIVSSDGRTTRALFPVKKGCSQVPAQDTAWAPEGEHIAVTRGCFGPLQGIWLHDLRGRTVRRIVRDAYSPAWSPTGEQLAFERDCYVWVADLTQRTERRINSRVCPLFNITWSPDGQWLAFGGFSVRCPDGHDASAIWIVASTGSEAHELRLPCRFYENPSWRP